jgi:hypothetical protein
MAIFHLDCISWCRFTCLNRSGNKRQWCWMVNYISSVFLSPIINIVTSLSASPQRNTSGATDLLCQIVLTRKLPRNFGKWCQCSRRLEEKSCKKRNRVKGDLPVNMFLSDGFAWTLFSHSECGEGTFPRSAKTNIMLDSGKVPEDHHLSKICRGKIKIVTENVICLRIL